MCKIWTNWNDDVMMDTRPRRKDELKKIITHNKIGVEPIEDKMWDTIRWLRKLRNVEGKPLHSPVKWMDQIT